MDFGPFATVLDYASLFFNAVGAIVIIYGGGRAVFYTVQREVLRRKVSYNQVRFDFIQMLVFGLEFLIVADVLTTLISSRTLDNIAVLGGIVVIRTVLGYFLSREAKGLRQDS